MSETITIEFTPTKEDYASAIRGYYANDTATWIALAGVGLLFIIAIAGIFITNFKMVGPMLILAVPVPIFLALLFWLQPILMSQNVERNERLHAPATWKLRPDALVIKTSFGENKNEWNSFSRVIETKNSYLLVDAKNKRAFQVLPRRAFTSPEQEARVKAYLLNKVPGPK